MAKLGAHQMFNLSPATQEEHDSLVQKCQENGWLKLGGFDWQDDPWLEEYPYDFSRASTINDLADFFSSGNWAIRQGVLFGDLAFIQQVNGGDEWWTLKRCPDGSWLDFESYNMSRILPDMSRFTQAIASMQLATPDECKGLRYLMPKAALIWEGEAFPDDSSGYVRAYDENFELEVVASRIGRGVSMTAREDTLDGLDSDNFNTLLEQIKAAVEQASQSEKTELPPNAQGLSDKAKHAVLASENQAREEHAEQARVNER